MRQDDLPEVCRVNREKEVGVEGNLREHTECFKIQVHTTMRDEDGQLSKDTQWGKKNEKKR
jgi:hypothetical protein